MDITLASACWEKDYNKILNSKYGTKLFAVESGELFKFRTLFINNVNDYSKVTKMADRAVSQGVITNYYQSDNNADRVLSSLFGGIPRESFIRQLPIMQRVKKFIKRRKGPVRFDGYYFSIAPLEAIYFCKTEWLLFFTGDACIESKDGFDWVEKAIAIMEKDDRFIVANPVWNSKYEEAESEKEGELQEFWVSSGFSDQCFLVNVSRLKAINGLLNEKNRLSEKQYPCYGGQCFERRINAYMRNHNLKRLTYKNSSYVHIEYR